MNYSCNYKDMISEDSLGKNAIDQIKSGVINEGGVNGLADTLNISARHLRRIVKAKTGSTPMQLNQARRLHDVKLLVQKTKMPITEIAFCCDFLSLRQFNDAFKEAFKMTPRQMRKTFLANQAHIN